jgi:uncharacterized protein YjgD (DUF1641 family)
MSVDPLVTSAIIGFFGVVVGIGGYAFQNWSIKKNERERREFMIKRKKYENLVKLMVQGVHVVLTKKQRTSIEYKEQIDEATNLLWLYASDEVLRALKSYFASDLDLISSTALEMAYRNLILAMRNDLNIKTNLAVSDIIPFRFT